MTRKPAWIKVGVRVKLTGRSPGITTGTVGEVTDVIRRHSFVIVEFPGHAYRAISYRDLEKA